MFWQWGDTISTGQTANDGYTIYYGTSEWTSLVVGHVAAINGGTTTPPATSAAATMTAIVTSTSTSAAGSATSSSASSGATSSHWDQCAGIGYTGPWTCQYPNPLGILSICKPSCFQMVWRCENSQDVVYTVHLLLYIH